MNKGQVHIVSDGTLRGTKVTGPDGKPLPGVMKIEIQPVEPMGAVTAVVTFGNVALGPAGVEIVGELEEGA